MWLRRSKNQKRNKLQRFGALAIAAVPMAACTTHTPALTSKVAITSFAPITSSPLDTCETKRQIAAHNSAYDTLKDQKLTVYKARCTPPKKAKPKLKPEQATS